MEIQLLNAKFTWIGSQGKRSRLDRAFMNAEWYDKAEWSLISLPRKNSDHKGLILSLSERDWGPKLFRIFKYLVERQEIVGGM